MGISPDLPKGVVDIRKKQIETLKKAKKDGKRAYFSRADRAGQTLCGWTFNPCFRVIQFKVINSRPSFEL